MKKLFTILSAVLLTACVFLPQQAGAQSPEKMSYQAVVRDASDNLVTSSSVGMQISILQGSSSGTAVYVETQTPNSNSNGLVSIEIGDGTVVSGDFIIIDWAKGPYFIKTETDPTGGTNYTITGTSQLLSVPYALHAGTVDNGLWNENDGEIFYTNGNVGIGTNNPAYNLDIINSTGEAYARLRSNSASSSFIIDKYSVSHIGQIIYQQNHVNKFFAGLLGNNNYRISTDRFSLIGLEVQGNGNVLLSNNLTVNGGFGLTSGADNGKVLTSDASGNATWQTAPGAPKTKYLSIPGMGFHNNRPIDNPTKHFDGYVTSGDNFFGNVLVSFPISLPHGAVITGVSITVFDNTDNDFTVRLYSNEFNTTFSLPPQTNLIVDVRSSGSATGDRTFTADLSGINPYDLTIDKDRVYYLEATWQLIVSNELYMAFERVLITYIE